MTVYRNSFTLVYFSRFLVFVSVIWCFNEPCADDVSCAHNGLRCHFEHCLCPARYFWAGDQKKCMECPPGWFNFIAFCIYYDKNLDDWLNANRRCLDMSTVVGVPTRLLEFYQRNEFEFIQRVAPILFGNDQLTLEANHSLGSLWSTMAFVGSQGQRLSTPNWSYQWGHDGTKSYSTTSPMWCSSRTWFSVVVPAEPALESVASITTTVQAFKRWQNSTEGCLVSLRTNSIHGHLCEIVADSDRLHNQSILYLLPSSAAATTVSSGSRGINLSKNDSFSAVLFSNGTTSLRSNVTKGQLKLSGQRWLFIVVGIIGAILIFAILIMIVMCLKHRKKDTKKDGKSNEKLPVPRSPKVEKDDPDDGLSNGSFESSLTAMSADARSETSAQSVSDDVSVVTMQSKAIKSTKMALWDETESSLFPPR